MTMTSLLWRHSWPGPTSLKIIPVLYKPAYRLPQGTGGGVQVVQDIPGYERWRKICANLILASRQGFGELKTEQLGGHSQEQQRHRQTPIDDDVECSGEYVRGGNVRGGMFYGPAVSTC